MYLVMGSWLSEGKLMRMKRLCLKTSVRAQCAIVKSTQVCIAAAMLHVFA